MAENVKLSGLQNGKGIMDLILMSPLGKAEEITVKFKKTVNTGQYETEVYEADTAITVGEEITGIEREIIMSVALAELEHATLVKLVVKGRMSRHEFDMAVEQSEYGIRMLYEKAHKLGVDTSNISKYIHGAEW